MRKPKDRGVPIDQARLQAWVARFSSYRAQVSNERVGHWLDQFADPDKDLAARTLDAVRFISLEQIHAAYRALLRKLPGWSPSEAERNGRWRFVALSSSAGESGDSMLHVFRRANAMNSTRLNNLFIHKSDLLREGITKDDTVVFVDDFAGTGTQVSTSWSANLRELMPEFPTTYLLLVAATARAKKKIHAETGLRVLAHFNLSGGDDILSLGCRHFTNQERSKLLVYCAKADRRAPRGFGDCGLVIAFSHGCPNNSIPILHRDHRRWRGLFP